MPTVPGRGGPEMEAVFGLTGGAATAFLLGGPQSSGGALLLQRSRAEAINHGYKAMGARVEGGGVGEAGGSAKGAPGCLVTPRPHSLSWFYPRRSR